MATMAPVVEAGMETKSLVEQAAGGNLEAFEALLRQYEKPVLGLCTRILSERADAEEAAQDVFWRLYKNLKKIDTERALEPWLFRITWNVCKDRLRRRRKAEPIPEGLAGPAATETALLLGEVRAAIERLPDRERAALLLREVEGLETEEVAARLGTAPVTVRSQIARARTKLRRWLGGTS
jgi:RNA polymerase sigma-70 factor, ECF subfamily